MLIVKLMSGEDRPDEDPRKSYVLRTGVSGLQFFQPPEGPAQVTLSFPNGDFTILDVEGNAYVMNEAGKTISSYCPPGPPDTISRDTTSQPLRDHIDRQKAAPHGTFMVGDLTVHIPDEPQPYRLTGAKLYEIATHHGKVTTGAQVLLFDGVEVPPEATFLILEGMRFDIALRTRSKNDIDEPR